MITSLRFAASAQVSFSESPGLQAQSAEFKGTGPGVCHGIRALAFHLLAVRSWAGYLMTQLRASVSSTALSFAVRMRSSP